MNTEGDTWTYSDTTYGSIKSVSRMTTDFGWLRGFAGVGAGNKLDDTITGVNGVINPVDTTLYSNIEQIDFYFIKCLVR